MSVITGIVVAVVCTKWLRRDTDPAFWLKVGITGIVAGSLLVAGFWLYPPVYFIALVMVLIGGREMAGVVAESRLGPYALGALIGTWLSIGVLTGVYAV